MFVSSERGAFFFYEISANHKETQSVGKLSEFNKIRGRMTIITEEWQYPHPKRMTPSLKIFKRIKRVVTQVQNTTAASGVKAWSILMTVQPALATMVAFPASLQAGLTPAPRGILGAGTPQPHAESENYAGLE